MSKEISYYTNNAVKVDGTYIEEMIEGYTTLSSSGRESMECQFEALTVAAADGETMKYKRYPARTLTIEFLIEGGNLNEKMERLSNILSSDESDFVFNDEPDKFFTGVAIMPNEIERGTNWVNGSFQIYCTYPFKKSTALKVVTPSTYGPNSAQLVINYEGTHPARPLLQAEFAGALEGGDYSDDGDCGYVAFIDSNENIIQLGNPDAIDIDAYTEAVQLINREFTTVVDWQQSGGATFDDEEVAGSLTANTTITDPYWGSGSGAQSLKYIVPSYDEDSSHWHGPIIWQQPRAIGSVDWNMSAVLRMCCNATGQCGSFELGAYNVTSNILKMVAGILIIKNTSGTAGTVQYIVDGKVVKTETIDLSYYNTHFGYCNRTAVYTQQSYRVQVKKKKKKVWETRYRSVFSGYRYTQSNLNVSIEKSNNAVTFKVGNLASYTYTDNDIENIVVHNISMHFGQMKDIPALHTLAVNSIRFTSNPTGYFADIPNVFTSGDVVQASCEDASVWLKHANTEDGQLAPQYGALGNDWEDFMLTKGQNIINVVWSDWVNSNYKPQIKVMYNDTYL